MKNISFTEIDKKWQMFWQEKEIFITPDNPKRKYYLLEMYAYPSGDIHIGHFRNYTIGDVKVKFLKMNGYDIMHPFGWDAFGLPAEEAAIKRKIDPESWTLNNIKTSRQTLKRIGISYDWNKEITTCLPDYYKWTQWIFLKLYERGLAYRSTGYVNWCPSCKTILANEQVEEGNCWRCHSIVRKKKLNQWSFKITDYAQRLLDDIERLKKWPENVKIMQRNWIGRSKGTEIDFNIHGMNNTFSVFTTRPDTLYGVTFMAIAPENSLVKLLVEGTEYRNEVEKYVEKAITKTDIERVSTVTEKDGVFTGRYAINPLSGEKIQLWVADYVLAFYGTGIVMGVPAHDQRDFEFAQKYNIPVKIVIKPDTNEIIKEKMECAFVEPGIMVNSGPFNNLHSEQGIIKISEYLEQKNLGRHKVNYKLRDWTVSRQRYWGAPIPVIYCDKCGTLPVPENLLPVLLPKGNIDFIPKGRSPLEDADNFINTTCHLCGGRAKRDPDTMDTFVCSSWYQFRYIDPKNDKKIFDPAKAVIWMPIDLYIGGVEHATGHLLYFRFITKVLYDIGISNVDEPVSQLFNHGMVLDSEGRVMSKSLGNTVSPIDLVQKYGADVCRIAMLFAAPSDKEIIWSEKGLVGAQRFLNRIIRFIQQIKDSNFSEVIKIEIDKFDENELKLFRKLNQTIQRVTKDIESLEYNTAIASIMELLNFMDKFENKETSICYYIVCKNIIKLIAPFAPHLGEELWNMTGEVETVFSSEWPIVNTEMLNEDMTMIVIQINGKVRDKFLTSSGQEEQEVIRKAIGRETVKKYLEYKTIIKRIYLKDKLINFVVK